MTTDAKLGERQRHTGSATPSADILEVFEALRLSTGEQRKEFLFKQLILGFEQSEERQYETQTTNSSEPFTNEE